MVPRYSRELKFTGGIVVVVVEVVVVIGAVVVVVVVVDVVAAGRVVVVVATGEVVVDVSAGEVVVVEAGDVTFGSVVVAGAVAGAGPDASIVVDGAAEIVAGGVEGGGDCC